MISRAKRMLNLAIQESNSSIIELKTPNSSSTTTHENAIPNFSCQLLPETSPILKDCTNQAEFNIENIPIVFLHDDVNINNTIENVDFNIPVLFPDQEINSNSGYENIQPSTSACCSASNINEASMPNFDSDYAPGSSDSDIESVGSDEDIDDRAQDEETVSNEGKENNEASWGDINEGRKRKIIADKTEWKRTKNQMLRMKGENYIGFSRDKNKRFKHDVPRAARKLGEPCVSKLCLKSKKRFCNTLTEQIRKEIFSNFWEKITWDQRKLFVSGHVRLQSTSRKTKQDEDSRRENTMVYHLHNGKELVQVCRKTFLNTIGLGRFTVESWVKSNVYNINESKCEQNKQSKHKNYRVNSFKESKSILRWFFDELPKQPSHYARKDTNKLYLEQQYATLKQLHEFYKETCTKIGKQSLGIQTFKLMFKKNNLSLFSPKKDRCDLCIEYENKNIEENLWKKHIDDKEKARKEKTTDKDKAVKKECILLCMDLQAVKVTPTLNATKIYFKTKLSCHNFTIYNSTSHQSTCYWFTETDSGLQASTFASCVIDYLERHCLRHNLPIIIYSDGCTFQNRNNILSNALLNFAVMHGIPITQKYLTKGHTQMECDSVHSCIERKLKNRVIELPSDYVKASMEARKKPEPYEVIQIQYDFFNDYTKSENLRYSNIKPGRDTLVTDIKALYYDVTGEIKVKTDFDEEFKNLPSRPRQIDPVLTYPKLYKGPLPIKEKKWKHLQDLKSVISRDCHFFYDNLPYTPEAQDNKNKSGTQNKSEVKKLKSQNKTTKKNKK